MKTLRLKIPDWVAKYFLERKDEYGDLRKLSQGLLIDALKSIIETK
mgnify:CR=1 FL=1